MTESFMSTSTKIEFVSARPKALVVVAPLCEARKYDPILIEALPFMLEQHNRQCIICEYILPLEYQTNAKIWGRRVMTLAAIQKKIVDEVWVYGEVATNEFREIIREAYIARLGIRDLTSERSTAKRYINLFWKSHNQAQKSA